MIIGVLLINRNMLIDRDSAVITDLKIDDNTCYYSLEVVDDIENALILRKEWNNIYKPIKKELLELNEKLGNMILSENIFYIKEIKSRIKELKKQRKSLETEHQDLLKRKKIANSSRRKLKFFFDLSVLKDNCVCCGDMLPLEMKHKVLHRIKYGNYCKKCG